MGSGSHRRTRTRLDGAIHHCLRYQVGIINWGWRLQSMARVVTTIAETWGVHNRGINIADVDIWKFG